MIEHIVITVLICFTVLVAIGQVCSVLQEKWKRRDAPAKEPQPLIGWQPTNRNQQ